MPLSRSGRKAGTEPLRFGLFLATGLAVPLYAFPVARVVGKPVDLATILAGLFVVASLPSLFSGRFSRGSSLFLASAILVPLLVLIPPRPPLFSLARFMSSYAHWLLVISFFFFALCLMLPEGDRRRLIGWNLVAGLFVALFALYQVVGIPRGWPATSTMLVSFQREPLRFMSIGGYVRPTSIFLEPAWMGGYLSATLALGIALLVRGRPTLPPWRMSLGLLAVALILLAILSTISWGAYTDLLAVLLVSFIVFVRHRPMPRVVLGSAAAVAALLLVLILSTSGKRILAAAAQRWRMTRETPVEVGGVPKDVQDSTWIRYRNLVHSANIFRSSPLRGVGLGQFGRYSGSGGTFMDIVSRRDPWCGWLAIAAEVGVLGPLLLLGVILLAGWRGNRQKVGVGQLAIPTLLGLAVVQQMHTGSYIDLWWWYGVFLAGALSCDVSVPIELGES